MLFPENKTYDIQSAFAWQPLRAALVELLVIEMDVEKVDLEI